MEFEIYIDSAIAFMKNDEVKNELAEVGDNIGRFAHTAGSIARSGGTRFARAVSKRIKTASDKAQDAILERRLARLNPVFPEQYKDPSFDLPNLIIIEDEDIRKGITECEGAIGWITIDDGLEILHLYEEAIPFTGLMFYPPPAIGSSYYRDRFDSNRYINLNSYHSAMHQDRITELRNIAHSLGAKECKLESIETEHNSEVNSLSGSLKSRISNKSTGIGFDNKTSTKEDHGSYSNIEFSQKFEGSKNRVRPDLRWFANDRELNSLIEMALSEENVLKEYKILLDSSLSSSMEHSHAAKIDTALKKLGVSANSELAKKTERESHQKLYFYIVF